MKIIVTGGAGFVGSHLVDRLVAAGNDVTVIDNFITARKDNLENSLASKNLKIVEGSIADEHLMNGVFSDVSPEVVVHAAASYRDPDDFEGDATTNALGTARVIRQCKRVGVKRLVYLQTALCYGPPQTNPIQVTHPLNPGLSSYAITKTTGEYLLKISGLNYVSFRLANAYGPRNMSGPLPTFYRRLKEGKPCFVVDTRRDFIYVQDMVTIIEKATHGMGNPGCYHISTGRDYSILELYQAVAQALRISPIPQVEVKPRGADDVESLLLDPTLTLQEFGFKPNKPLGEGIQETIAYYETHGVGETFTHLRLPQK